MPSGGRRTLVGLAKGRVGDGSAVGDGGRHHEARVEGLEVVDAFEEGERPTAASSFLSGGHYVECRQVGDGVVG